MKKVLTLLAALLCLSLTRVIAQDHGSLSLSLGPAIPAGEFANGDPLSHASGLALPGGLIDLSYRHDIPRSPIGFIASFRVRMNPISGGETAAAFESQFPDYQWSVNKQSWKVGALLVGIYYQHPVSKKVFIEPSFSMGLASAVLPENNVRGIKDTGANHYPTDLILVHTNKVTTNAFNFSLRFGAGYRLTPRLSLIAHLDFWYMEPNFGGFTESVLHAQGFNSSISVSPQDASSIMEEEATVSGYDQKMSTFDLAVGLCLKL